MKSSIQNEQSNGRRIDASIELSMEDQQHLLAYEKKCDFLRDRTRSVAERFQNGAYLTGRSGSGKTTVVTQTLEEIGARYTYRNARMTPIGLFKVVEEHPEHTIVLDDIVSLFDERQALQILLAAVGGKIGEPRPVTYTTANKHDRRKFYFTGGIIAISNRPLRRDPLADALGSRMVLQDHEPSDEELAAVMRHLACNGFMDLTPPECREVVEFIISESRANDYRLDLRSMEKGWQDYRQYKGGKTRRTWQELVCASMTQLLRQTPRASLSKQEQIALEAEQVRRAMEKFPGDTARQMVETGLKKTAFYERRRMVTVT